jgi:hypothetical protein
MADSKPVGSFTLLKTELKRIFEKGLLLSSYNSYSQFMPRCLGQNRSGLRVRCAYQARATQVQAHV